MLSLVLAALLSGSSAPDLYRADGAHAWRPATSTVSLLERTIRVPKDMGGPLNNFDRYYTGLYRNGRKIVFVELLNLSERPPGQGVVHVARPGDVPMIADGGCSVIRLSYDPETKAFSDLQCNFDLRPPPPPPGG